MRTNLRTTLVDIIDAPFRAEFPDVPLIYQNQPFDWSHAPDFYVELEFEVDDREQITISHATPRTRAYGAVFVTVYGRTGTGTARALGVLDWFTGLLQYRSDGPLQFQVASDGQPEAVDGWFRQSATFPFFTHEA